MARSRLKVSPKISSQSTGWMARVYNSARSCRTLSHSARQSVTTLLPSRRHIGGAGGRSTKTARGATGTADITETPLLFQQVTSEMTEHIFQGGRGAQTGLEPVRRAHRPYLPIMHHGD